MSELLEVIDPRSRLVNIENHCHHSFAPMLTYLSF